MSKFKLVVIAPNGHPIPIVDDIEHCLHGQSLCIPWEDKIKNGIRAFKAYEKEHTKEIE